MTDQTSLAFFSETYSDSRARFLGMAERVDAEVTTVAHPLRGPENEPLFTDIAHLGPPHARMRLLVQSGTHGVEGFCGSAIQSALLSEISAAGGIEDISLVLVHAINPFGFAWHTRGDENNVDLNRNFIDFTDEAQKKNELFQELVTYLVPLRWEDEAIDSADEQLQRLRLKHGEKRVSQALRKGQYHYPDSLFYGGTGPSWSNRTVGRIAGDFLRGAESVVFLDIHSGLGDYGEAVLLSVDPPGSAEFRTISNMLGSRVRSTHDPASDASNANGNIVRGYSECLPDVSLIGAGLEFGTYEQKRVQRALRASTWLNVGARADVVDADTREKIRSETLEVFCPSDPNWRAQIIHTGLDVCQRAVQGLSRMM